MCRIKYKAETVNRKKVKRTIIENLEKLAKRFDSFKFREGQIEVIADVIEHYNRTGGRGIYVLEAPTGSGKSIIATFVSLYLNVYLNKDGYILASDIALQEQYEDSLMRYGIPWGSVKGVDNYICNVNNEKHSLGDCKIRGISGNSLKKLICYPTCEYYSNRQKAMDSKTSVLNYAYWLIQRNYVSTRMDNPPFKERDFVICDETHKVTDIVQNHFSPTLNVKRTPEFLEKIIGDLDEYGIQCNPDIKDNVTSIINRIYETNDKNEIHNLLQRFELLLEYLLKRTHSLKHMISSEYPSDKKLPRYIVKMLNRIDALKDLHCKIEDYVEFSSKDTNDIIKIIDEKSKRIDLKYVNDEYLMDKYFYPHCKFTLMMSATIGGSGFMEEANLVDKKNVKYNSIGSSFKFNNSPIYIFTGHSMSYNKIQQNEPWLYDTIRKALNNHPNDKGIIHTASYKLANKIIENVEHDGRLIMYNDSESKRLALMEFVNSKNKVLIGPSILEGLDFKNDMSRFQIIAKVPYQNLKDEYVLAKMKKKKKWYEWKTIINILQGIGRSIRNEDDWAYTYILDDCFVNLYYKNLDMFNETFTKRVCLIK